jgi:hypothetical protein
MGKHRDLAGILLMVIIGMFIPFLGSIAITYGFNFTHTGDWLKIASTFGYFLVILGIELAVVFLYYKTTNKIANKKLEKYKSK